jgi:hypothetical protein
MSNIPRPHQPSAAELRHQRGPAVPHSRDGHDWFQATSPCTLFTVRASDCSVSPLLAYPIPLLAGEADPAGAAKRVYAQADMSVSKTCLLRRQIRWSAFLPGDWSV